MGRCHVSHHDGGRVTLVARWIFNVWIVHGDGGSPLVVDPGLPSTAAAAASEIARRGRHGPPVVACTHGHTDHVAGVPTVTDRFDVGYLLPATCERYLRNEAPPPMPPGPREVAKIAPVMASQPVDLDALVELAPHQSRAGHTATGMVMPIEPAGFLADGEGVDGLDGWLVLNTPGHTEDSTCLYHEATQTLVSGDTILTHEDTPWFNPEITDADASGRTEARLRDLPVRTLLPGHGRPVFGENLLAGARSWRDRPSNSSVSGRLANLLGSWR